MNRVSRLLRLVLYSPPQRNVLPEGALQPATGRCRRPRNARKLLFAEVLADDGDQVDVREERRGQREVGQRPAELIGYSAERRLDRIECN